MATTAETFNSTSSCVHELPELQCHWTEPGTEPVCSAGEADRRAGQLHAVTVLLTGLILPVSVLLNLAVVVTVILNRKLHTIINALVVVLGVSNLVWTGLPIVVLQQMKHLEPVLCAVRASIFIITRGVNFTVIVSITLLRYLMVVRNHSYPANTFNVMLFVTIAVMPAVVKWLIRRSHEVTSCSPVVARNPDGFLIIAKFESSIDLVTGLIALVEYGGGLFILGFCYTRILPRPATRVDLVATLSMTAFIVILFLVIFPYTLGVGLVNSRSVCVITAEMRIVMLLIVLISSSLGAVLSPVVLVLFSADFRRAFRRFVCF
ncbi:hypothetical protein FJT64_000196 [Amphibalanus amphitrite]|uniref:G-protein coupled receptors family 1 profile domain-containing protein n=1 Tax=Amphibalanus amphitrite TaxID=1232801 RepID=A0A6A4XDB6_AMPAM|nr:hypothetical protein FJT64_000196 [Amphibalanus amphitrite]